MSESVEKFAKVYVDDLSIGMYVSQLDRPWTETGFMFQGFRIQSPDDISELQQACEFVFVDKEKSVLKDIRSEFSLTIETTSSAVRELPACPLPTDPDFKTQMRHSLRVHSMAKKYIDKILSDIQQGKDIDIKEAKSLVSNLTKNIMENPMALIWLTQLKNRDEYTANHSLNVCILALFFGRSLGFNTQQLNELGIGALLHDVGKLRVPLEILNKPDRLTDDEFAVMKKHTLFGYDLLKNKDELSQEALVIIQQHHERVDGHGYPYGLENHSINLYSKIVKIVDVYDAVTSKRPYQDGVSPYHALNCIYSDRNGAFDEELVQQFLKHMGIYPVGCTIELNTGEIGIVTSINEKRHLTPTLLLLFNTQKQPLKQHKYMNLASECWGDDKSRPRIEKVVNPDEYNLDISQIFSKEAIFVAYDNAEEQH
ncbi:HD-GYP domain-containing protein [Kaarinaea lacus]